MNTDAENQQQFATCEQHFEKEEFEQALTALDQMDCIMASWMRGKIYLAMVKKIASSLDFKFYCTPRIMEEYRAVLTRAYEHLYKTCCFLPKQSREIKDRLNPVIWYEMSRVENELVRTRPKVEEINYDMEDADCVMDKDQNVQSVVNELEFLKL